MSTANVTQSFRNGEKRTFSSKGGHQMYDTVKLDHLKRYLPNGALDQISEDIGIPKNTIRTVLAKGKVGNKSRLVLKAILDYLREIDGLEWDITYFLSEEYLAGLPSVATKQAV